MEPDIENTLFKGKLYTRIESKETSDTIRDKMRAAKRLDGTPVYTLGSGISLLIFYVFAMQCMSTLAVVKRETRSWKYPALQFIYMLGLAYICAWAAFQIFK